MSNQDFIGQGAGKLTPEQAAFLDKYENKHKKKEEKRSKRRANFKEKLEMYDMIIANLIAGVSIIEPTQELDSSQIHIGFSNLASADKLSKYFMINKYPDYMPSKIIDLIRTRCMAIGVKINFYFYAIPHKIDWDSPEMKNRMTIWRKYTKEHEGPIDIFAYRTQYGEAAARNRVMISTKYLNEAEIEYKRSMFKVTILIEVSADRNEESLSNMAETVKAMKTLCSQSDIKLAELRINLIDWLRALGPYSLKEEKEVSSKIARRVLTDDLLANFNSYKQGRVGMRGIPLGIDVLSGGPVLRKFKEDPDEADNWIISAETGGGKSFFLKTLMTYLLADGFIGCIMDYEGDEYTNLANYIRAANPRDVKIISMGKGSNVYFDPCEIAELTGDEKVDEEGKETAIGFIMSMFRVMVCGLSENFTKEQERIISLAISRMYDTAGVTDDKETWKYSKGLRIKDVYDEIVEMVESKELVDNDSDNSRHKAAIEIVDATAVYFDEGAAKATSFKHPMSVNELYDAKLIIFSFGMKGLASSAMDQTTLALKQLCVAYINIQISNHCKYVRKCFNFKAWEEFQRWGDISSSADIIGNAITGGRKRGDINFIITNDLGSLLNVDNDLMKKIAPNIQNYAIGKIPDKSVRIEFCKRFEQMDSLPALDKIAKAALQIKSASDKVAGTSKTGASQNRYANSFCIMLNTGEKAVVKARLPQSLLQSKLFKTGVEIETPSDEDDPRDIQHKRR